MKKLLKLVSIEYFFYFFVISAALTTTFFVFDTIEFVDDLGSLTLPEITKAILFKVPYFFSNTTFFSTILAGVLSFNALKYRLEVVVLYSSGVNLRKIAFYYLILILFTTTLSYINESLISPYFLKRSLMIIGKERDVSTFQIKNLALKKENSFFFIETLEKKGTIAKNICKVTLNKDGAVEEVLVVPYAEKEKSLWLTKRAYKFNNLGEKFVFEGNIDLIITNAISSLNAKNKLLTTFDIIELLKFGKNFNIDVSKETHLFFQRILHIFSPILIFSIFLLSNIVIIDDKKKIIEAIKILFFLMLYTIIEKNLYNYAVANKLNALVPFFLVLTFLTVALIVKGNLFKK